MDIRVWQRSVRRRAWIGAFWAAALVMFAVPTALAASGSGSGGGGDGNQPPPSTPPVFQSITFTPATVVGGGGATGKVQFSGPTDGAGVSLTSSNPAVVQVPSEAVVIRLASSGTFAGSDGQLELSASRYRLLCELVGATRESVSLVLSRLVADGLVEREGSTLVVRRAAELASRLERLSANGDPAFATFEHTEAAAIAEAAM